MTEPKTSIDWLRFRTQAGVPEGLEALRPLFGAMGEHLRLVPLAHGRDGFEQACQLEANVAHRVGESYEVGLALGRVDFGGRAQRGWVRWNLPGQGCEWVKDWSALQAVEALPRAEIRRVDLALTTWHGEVGHEVVEAAHGAGLFTSGGRPPDLRMITSSNPRAGRTCYVGNRESDKFFRGYEKGFEMAAKWPGEVVAIDGCAVEDIYRCEVELKAKATVIPWEVVERRDHYFAGCYPFLAELLPDMQCDILMRRPERAPQTELLAALANCRQQYGATLFTALAAYQGDIFRVWDQIRGDAHNANLLAAGVLHVEH